MTRDHMKMLLNVVITASNTQVWTVTEEQLEKFAELVTAAEREACAKVCDSEVEKLTQWHPREARAVGVCADTIRVRGSSNAG
jgi:hypothetical protein